MEKKEERDEVYTKEEEKKLREHLKERGYLDDLDLDD